VSLELQFLGQPCIRLDGVDLTAQIGDKSIAVLAFLALEPQPLARKKVAGAFWSDKTDQAASYRLRHTLWELRRLIGNRFIASDQSHCWIEFDQDVRVDALEFRRSCQTLGVGRGPYTPHAEHAPQLSTLVEWYRGDLLDGLSAPDAPLYDEWLLVEREKFNLLYQETLWCLALTQQAMQAHVEAGQTLTRLIQIDPLRERSYRVLMNIRAQQGDCAGALRVHDQCARTLVAELGIAPSPETRRLRERIARGVPDSVGIELENAIAQAEAALAEGRPNEARTLLQSAKLVVRNLFR